MESLSLYILLHQMTLDTGRPHFGLKHPIQVTDQQSQSKSPSRIRNKKKFAYLYITSCISYRMLVMVSSYE